MSQQTELAEEGDLLGRMSRKDKGKGIVSRQKEFQAPAPKAYHSVSHQILLECLLYPGLCWARGWLLLSDRKRAQEGRMRWEESRTAGRSESILAMLMRNPRA